MKTTTLTTSYKPAPRRRANVPSDIKAAYADYREMLEQDSEHNDYWAETYWYLVGAQR